MLQNMKKLGVALAMVMAGCALPGAEPYGDGAEMGDDHLIGGGTVACLGWMACPWPSPTLSRGFRYFSRGRGEHTAIDLPTAAGTEAAAGCSGHIAYAAEHRGYGSARDYSSRGAVTIVACDDADATIFDGHCRALHPVGTHVDRGESVCSIIFYEGPAAGQNWSHIHRALIARRFDAGDVASLLPGYVPLGEAIARGWRDPLSWTPPGPPVTSTCSVELREPAADLAVSVGQSFVVSWSASGDGCGASGRVDARAGGAWVGFPVHANAPLVGAELVTTPVEWFNAGADEICVAAGGVTACRSLTIAPAVCTVEVCNGRDDDCDGSVDEGCGGDPSCVATVEVCNGGDDDCDGLTDEDNPGGGGACGTDEGACRSGVLMCSSGSHSCIGQVEPTVEVPGNGVDDDCDGTVDEGTAPPPPTGGTDLVIDLGPTIAGRCGGPVQAVIWPLGREVRSDPGAPLRFDVAGIGGGLHVGAVCPTGWMSWAPGESARAAGIRQITLRGIDVTDSVVVCDDVRGPKPIVWLDGRTGC